MTEMTTVTEMEMEVTETAATGEMRALAVVKRVAQVAGPTAHRSND
jgi:hypothetical protein